MGCHASHRLLCRPVFAGLFTFVFLAGLTASAQTIVYQNFNSTTGLTINGDAAVTTTDDGKVMRLAPALSHQAGTFFTDQKYNITGFSTIFQFRITNRLGSNDDSGRNGADGLAFIIQNTGKTEVGSTGEGLGYHGIGSSVAIEFDTFFNSNKDPSISNGGSNHVGISLGGDAASVLTAKVDTNMDDGDKWTVWVDYNGSVLEVRMSIDGLRPTTAILSKEFSASSTIGASTAYLGFSAGTGGAHTNHDLLAWGYSDTFVSGGLTAVPEPGTYALLGLGGLMLLGARRFRRAR